jgi:hypothetical protein
MAPEPQPEDPRDDAQGPRDQHKKHEQHEQHGSRGADGKHPRQDDARRLSSALFPGDIPQDDLDAYVGMPRREAERQASARGWRPVRSLPPDAVVTMEYVAGRLNFTVDADHVTRCWAG